MQKQKEVSTLIGVVVVIAFAIILFGGAIIYQNFVQQQVLSSFLQACVTTTH